MKPYCVHEQQTLPRGMLTSGRTDAWVPAAKLQGLMHVLFAAQLAASATIETLLKHMMCAAVRNMWLP